MVHVRGRADVVSLTSAYLARLHSYRRYIGATGPGGWLTVAIGRHLRKHGATSSCSLSKGREEQQLISVITRSAFVTTPRRKGKLSSIMK